VNPAPRRAADDPTDPQASLWVSANAGAGKTHVLIERVARLLLAGAEPERILCLAFTKAAAAEMANRLNERLGGWVLATNSKLAHSLEEIGTEAIDGALIANARRLFARALETPGGLKIQTIHAFCERLLKRFPIEAGLSPNFEVLDELSADDLLREASEHVLAAVTTGARMDLRQPLARVAGSGEEALSKIVKDLASDRSALQRFLDVAEKAGGAEALVCKALDIPPGETAEKIKTAAIRAIPVDDLRAVAHALEGGSSKDQDRAQKIAEFLDATDKVAAFHAYLAAFFTQKDTPTASLATKPLQKKVPTLETVLRQEQTRLGEVRARMKACEAAMDTWAALTVGGAALDRYAALKRARAALDYDDLIARTADLLRGRDAAAWVLYKLDGGLDHILVDEAQDTSPEQWQVIAALAEEFFAGRGARENLRTIFAVGDEKQSIFSFQGADPDAFDVMRRHFAERVDAAGRLFATPALERSYRSTKPILALVDRVFAHEEQRRALSRSATPLHHVLERAGQAGLVELWPTEKPERTEKPNPWYVPVDYVSPTSSLARLARRVADHIARLIKNERLLSLDRPVKAGDIIVLVRRRNAFVDTLIRLLKVKGIPVAGSDRLMLTEHIAVMDLMAAGAFALLPEDDLTLATVLRSPLCGLSEDELFDLAHGRPGTLWDALRGKVGTSPSLDSAHALLSGLLARADFDTPFSLYARLLGSEGGRKALVSRLGEDANDPIDEFLARALHYERLHPPSLQGFLHWLEAGSTEIKRDMEHGRDEVRVMTVHGAKGLQANVVILPDTCGPPYRPAARLLKADGNILHWSPRAADAPPQVARVRADIQAREEAEHLRLLYVALTRARDRLYVCGYETKNGRPENSWHALVERALTEIGVPFSPYAGATGYRLESPQEKDPDRADETLAEAFKAETVPNWVFQAAPAPTIQATFTPSRLIEDTDEPPVLSPLTRDMALARYGRGRLIHKLLELLPTLPPDARAAAARKFLARPTHGLTREAQQEIASVALGVLEAADFAAFFVPESRAEAAIVGNVTIAGRNFRVNGIVDRLALVNGRVLVIDYKTNRPPPQSLADVPRLYLRQMALYRAVLAKVYAGRTIECALLWTEGPRWMRLPSEMLDEAQAGLARLDGRKGAS